MQFINTKNYEWNSDNQYSMIVHTILLYHHIGKIKNNEAIISKIIK